MKKPRRSISQGCLFKLGEHRLICGDASDTGVTKKLIGDASIRLILTDPPYGVSYVENRGFKKNSMKKKIANDDLKNEEYVSFTRKWLEAVKPFITTKNSLYIFNSDKMIFALQKGMEEAGYRLAQLLIWVKNQPVIGRLDYLMQHELIAYGWLGTHRFFKSKDKSVFFCPKPQKSKLHPTMKPVSLLRRLILNSSQIGDFVYDPFGGSGSTLIACEQTKRRCLMVEIDLEYCQTTINRFEKLIGKKS